LILCSQERFLLSEESEQEPKTTWWVPITYTKKSNIDFDTTVPKVWLENESETHIPETLASDEWFVLNIQETGTDLKVYTLCLCVYVSVRACVRACADACMCLAPLLKEFYENKYECHDVRSRPVFKFLFL
jgi:hypothetical protein